MGLLGTRASWRHYATTVRLYRREADSVIDLARLLQVRLAQSKVGWIVCRRQRVAQVNLRSLGDVAIRSHTTDISVLGELLEADTYLPVVEAINANASTVVDLGANTGLAARWFNHRLQPNLLLCVEPEPGNVEILEQNMRGVRAANVVAACVGAWPRETVLDTSGGEFAVKMAEDSLAVGPSVQVLTMPDILRRAGVDRIDLLKCDIEGAEEELFGDCAEWIHQVSHLVIECHGSYDVEALRADLERNGAPFDLWHRSPNPDFGNEVAVLSARPAVGPDTG